MKKSIAKLINIFLILILFNSCITITPENRSQAVTELRKKGTVSIIKIPMENNIGPVYRINANSNNIALMVAGQNGIDLGYKYFIVIDSGTNQYVSGYVYQGTGGLSTSTIFSITISYTNDKNHNPKYNAFECSSLIDGYSFVTKEGQVISWTLFGTSLVGGTIVMLSALGVEYPDWNDPNYDSEMRKAEKKENGRFIGGGILMGVSVLFTIPLFMK